MKYNSISSTLLVAAISLILTGCIAEVEITPTTSSSSMAISSQASESQSSQASRSHSDSMSSSSSDVSSHASSSSSAPDLSVAHRPENLSLCTAPAGIVLNEINDVVDWINAMPKPLTLACFVASLPRPLKYNAVVSNFSAQPSVGKHNPRVFVEFDRLWLSYVTQETLFKELDQETNIIHTAWDADGIQLLEMSYEVETDLPKPQSLKGELAFPVLDTLPANAPYAKIEYNDSKSGSICGACHANERVIEHIDGVPVFRSAMLRNHDGAEVGHGYLITEYLACDPNVNTGGGDENNEWYRCQMLDATYEFGDMLWTSFRDNISTF